MSTTGREDKKRYLRYAAVVLLVVFCVSAVLLGLSIWENRHSAFTEDNSAPSEVLEYEGEDYVLRDDIEAFLVMGLDKYDVVVDNTAFNNDRQADFLLLLVFNNTEKTCTGIHINRDTMAEMNVLGVAGEKIRTEFGQITLAHTYGNGKEVSCRNTVDAVSGVLLNVPIKHYASITMDAVPAYNDLVGGVTLTVLDDFTGVDDTLVQGEVVTLMGEHAVNYVRGRHGVADSTNMNRMKRQRQYLTELYKKTESCLAAEEGFEVKAVASVKDYIVSDCTVKQLETLLNRFAEYDFKEIIELEGDSQVSNGHLEFYPHDDSVKKAVVSLFYEKEE
ncbi:MAG: hypothetical protein E7595_01820 [Ruminococcaceae bacterium]|nr:hypothetical protein [Oscillospiraceae bacterium]